MANPTRLSSLKVKESKQFNKNIFKYIHTYIYSIVKTKPDPVNQPVRTAHTTAHHYNSTQYCSTETVLLIFSFL